ncbi:MAG: hypothetical protein LUO93_06220 [Methanomicrobiales archaeon]|nr:hypothetical protein [Methanomicrobiales archaeon]
MNSKLSQHNFQIIKGRVGFLNRLDTEEMIQVLLMHYDRVKVLEPEIEAFSIKAEIVNRAFAEEVGHA